eukprot:TRINITY_DN26105_c0_g1_i2.p3 TRINITY_DN26105_c0_g1~~TRINITY_DN26105_c0_g1_i2.p3  ORF type:complete len:261 (+),score=34.17 TRINITY_DN26105_c0_g1_i2:93-785(+)
MPDRERNPNRCCLACGEAGHKAMDCPNAQDNDGGTRWGRRRVVEKSGLRTKEGQARFADGGKYIAGKYVPPSSSRSRSRRRSRSRDHSPGGRSPPRSRRSPSPGQRGRSRDGGRQRRRSPDDPRRSPADRRRTPDARRGSPAGRHRSPDERPRCGRAGLPRCGGGEDYRRRSPPAEQRRRRSRSPSDSRRRGFRAERRDSPAEERRGGRVPRGYGGMPDKNKWRSKSPER